LGLQADAFLLQPPFNSWNFEDVTDEELQLEGEGPSFECRERGVEFLCDETRAISTIFLHVDRLDPALIDLALSSDRHATRQQFGAPERSGETQTVKYLGDYGPFDRYALPNGIAHFQFKVDMDRMESITLMRYDTAP
jgi:hypothetical protein